jgi:hypothetical protein
MRVPKGGFKWTGILYYKRHPVRSLLLVAGAWYWYSGTRSVLVGIFLEQPANISFSLLLLVLVADQAAASSHHHHHVQHAGWLIGIWLTRHHVKKLLFSFSIVHHKHMSFVFFKVWVRGHISVRPTLMFAL